MKKAFNVTADKVVSFTEFKQKVRALYKEELTFGEKVFMKTLDPVGSFFAMTGFMKDKIKGNLPFKFIDLKPKQWSLGSENFVNGDAMAVFGYYDLKNSFNKTMTQKTWSIGERAFEACKDYKDEPRLKRDHSIF